MDLMYIIILWLKNFIERMARITSFISGSFLPGDDDGGLDGTESGLDSKVSRK